MLNSGLINQLITPDNDGKNDTWNIPELKLYCERCDKDGNSLKIFNRWGALVYEKKNYMLDNDRFKGYSKNTLDFEGNNLLPLGTYFYIIEVGETVKFMGYIYIMR